MGPRPASARARPSGSRRDLDAWHGRPVFAYGFEDLTGAEWRLLEALAGRDRRDRLAPLRAGPARVRRRAADGRGPGPARRRPDRGAAAAASTSRPSRARPSRARALLRRASAAGRDRRGGPLPRGRRDARGALELVADEMLELVRGGTAPERIAVVCPSVERFAGPLETAFGAPGIPYALEGATRLAAHRVRRCALLPAPLRLARRRPRATCSRSCARRTPGCRAIGRLRRGPPARTRRSAPPSASRRRPRSCAAARSATSRCCAPRPTRSKPCASAPRAMTAAAHSPLDGPPRPTRRASTCAPTRPSTACSTSSTAGGARRRAVARGAPGRARGRDCSRRAGRRVGPRRGARPAARPHAAVRRRLPARARGGRAAAARAGVAVPRRDGPAPARRPACARGAPSTRPLPLLHRLCPRLAAPLPRSRGGERRRRAARGEPVLGRGARRLRSRRRRPRTVRRPLSALTRPLEDAPTERERLRALARLDATEPPRLQRSRRRTAGTGGSTARGARLRGAPGYAPGRARGPRRARLLRRHRARALRRLLLAWFVERYLDPRSIDAEVDAKLKGSVAHTALHKFFAGLPKELGCDRVEPERVEDAVRFMRVLPRRRARGRADGHDRAAAPRARPDAVARPGGIRSRRGGDAAAARARGASRSRSARNGPRRSSSAASTSTASRCPGRSTGSTSTRSRRTGS